MKYIFICILIIFSGAIIAQKTTKKDSVLAPMYFIKFDSSFRNDTLAADSTIDNLHELHPALKISPWYNTLTRSGYPIEFLQFTNRTGENELFYPARYLAPYLTNSDNNYFFRTNRQFSNLSYKTSGQDKNDEEFLQVIHTQNLTNKSNLGLVFYMNGSSAKVDLQKASNNTLDLFYRYSGEKYSGFYRFYFNSFSEDETGGLKTDETLNYKTDNVYGLDVRLKDVSSKFRRMGFVSSQQFNLLSKDSVIDSTAVKRKVFGSALYVLNLESNKRNYDENSIESGFYPNIFKRSGISSDSITLDKLSNKLTLRSPYIFKYLPDLSVSLTNEVYAARFGSIEDTLFIGADGYETEILNKKNYSQTFVSADAKQAFGYVDWTFGWDSYLFGYGFGDQKLLVTANLYADKAKKFALQLQAKSSLLTPSFMLKQSYANHFYFDIRGKFNREKKQELDATLRLGGNMLSLTGRYTLLNDFIYFDETALPRQASQLQLLTGEAESVLKFWKFRTENKVVLQQPDNEKSVHIPRLLAFHSLEFQHTFHFFTGGRLYTQLGYDVTYTTSYKASAYMPALGVFYLQNEQKTGDYAKVDVHLTMKVKTVSFFLKLSHVNALLTNRQFTALHYPMLPMVFSYGINWLFYD